MSAASPCLHCSATVAAPEKFCCRGCETAYGLLNQCDLSAYYALSDNVIAPPNVDGTAGTPAWLEQLAQDVARGRSVTFHLRGLHCAGCVWVIQALFEQSPGAIGIDLNPTWGRVTLRGDETFDLIAYCQKLQALGYFAQVGQDDDERAPSDGLLLKTGALWAVALNAMVLGFATYFGLSADNDPLLNGVFGALSLALGGVSVAIALPVFLRPAWAALRGGFVSLDLPIVFGMLAVGGASALAYFTLGFADSYFDTLSVFNALMVTGRFVQNRLVEKNRRAMHDGGDFEQMRVRRIDGDDVLQLVTITTVEPGDRLLIVPGESLLTDARASAAGEWNFAALNGEALPRRLEAGADLPAGVAYAGTDAATVDVTRRPQASNLTRALSEQDVSSARNGAARWLPAAYVIGVLAAAAIGAAIWWDAPLTDMGRVVAAVLVVTCPCAYGIAGPLAVARGTAVLRNVGLFVKNPDVFFRLKHVSDIFLDKTGTITEAVPQWTNRAAFLKCDATLRAAVRQMTARSLHPISASIFSALQTDDVALVVRRDIIVTEVLGQGIDARIDERDYALRARDGALTLFVDGAVAFTFAFEDRTERRAAQEVAALHAAGYAVHVLSGDAPERTAAVAQRVGIAPQRCHGGLTPADKARIVAAAENNHAGALMVGDGLNDVDAMNAATCAGTPRSTALFVPRAADFFFVREGFVPLTALLATAQRVRRVRLCVFTLAALYNVCVLALAWAAWVSPVVCAVLMPTSSAIFIALSLALVRAPTADGTPSAGLASFLRTTSSTSLTERPLRSVAGPESTTA